MQVFGHRGSPGFPRFGENTRTSFRKALDAGAAGFELDVRRCRDGTLIVLHDATIDRTTNGSGLAATLNYEQLARFDAGHGDSIPRLADILKEFAPRGTIHTELKESGLARDVAAMAAAGVVVSAFDADDNGEGASANWADLHSIASTVPVALIATARKIRRIGYDGFVDAARRHAARAIHPPRDAVSPELMDIARRADLPVRVWTVNNPAEAIHFRDMGVESIFSDSPQVCLKALAQ